MINPGTENAIEQLYVAFSCEAKPSKIDVCKCCVSEQELKKLLTVPLRQLTADQLMSYTSSVFLTSGSEEDFRYLLPRILEISIRNEFTWPDREVVCCSLLLGNWQAWPEPLKAAISQALSCAWEDAIAYNNGEDVDEWLCGFARAGLDVRNYLIQLEMPYSEKGLITFYERNSYALMKGKLGNSFWDDKAQQQPVIDWFNSPAIQDKLNRHYGMG